MTRHVRAAATAAALVTVASFQLSATPGFWQAATLADFLRGDVENLSIDEHGRMMLGPELRRVHETGAPFVWTSVPGPNDSMFLGTGNDGKVVRVDRSGNATVFFDSNEMEVHALAPAADGGLYVGTSPDGRIYRVDAKGVAAPFFDPEDKYIWALAVDTKGVVYAATGDKGVVYRITADGTGTPFFSTKTTHAITMAFDRGGNLLVGTGAPGRVFRVDTQGRGFLVLDTQHQEIRALRLDPKGLLYVAAQSGRPSQGGETGGTAIGEPTPQPSTPSVSTEITSIAIIEMPVASQASSTGGGGSDRRGPTGAVYRVLPDGLWDVIWESRDDAPYDVALEADGALLVATGSRGKIFRLAGDPSHATLLTRVAAQQAVTLHRAGDRTWIATSNPGQLVALAAERATRGTYESDVKDARVVSSWGTIAWRATSPAGTRVEVQTRSGNTRTPDEAWSEWSASYADANGSRISSPNARYLQWRAILTGKGETPVLTSVSAAYLQRNIRPDVASITVHPPGVVFQKPFSSGEAEIAGFNAETMERRVANQANSTGAGGPGAPTLGRRTYQKGLQTLIWKAEDDNGDELTYDVLYRREGETTWKTLATALTDTILVWDTSSAPNGAYVVKIVASDRKSNPADTALKGERESASFDVDNTAPVVTVGTAKRDGGNIVVPFEVRDADSVVTRVEYSVDSQPWQSAFPQDGILDARREQFSLPLEAALAGRTLVIRATDAMNNVGTGELVLR